MLSSASLTHASLFQGVSQPPSGTTQCIILCDGWCGWLYLLPTFGLQCVAVFSLNPGTVWFSTSLLGPPVLHHIDQWDLASIPADCNLLLGTGSEDWFHRYFHTSWLSRFRILWSCIPPESVPNLLPTLPYRLPLAHHAHGGVLRGTFLFVSSCPFTSVPISTLPVRGLHHILGVAVQGCTPVVAPPAPVTLDTSFIEWGDNLPALHPLGVVRC
jgi:hypothetical protein